MLLTAYVVLATSPTRQLGKHLKELGGSRLSPEQQTQVLVAQATGTKAEPRNVGDRP